MKKTEFDGVLSPPRVGVTRNTHSPDSGSGPDTHTHTQINDRGTSHESLLLLKYQVKHV